MKFTSKQVTTIIVSVAATFIVMAILTLVIGDDENTDETSSINTESSISTDSGTSANSDSGAPTDSDNGSAQQPKANKLDSTDYLAANKKIESDPYKELDELIGLEGVKKEVHDLANFVKVQKLREEQGLKVPKISYHLVFTGSPGTGKTTVARIVARIYKDLGILEKGHLVETDRSGLVAEYVGQTAMKTNAIIDSAMGGVLFIDEAYALVPEHAGSDYGQEAISTLLKRMEDDRDRLVVVIAGYTNEMKRFINANPGLQSRFNRYIDFPDYTADELFRIFELQAKKNQYQLNAEAAYYLRERLDYVVQHKNRNFGNGRYSRNLFEKSIQNQANRLSSVSNPTTEMLSELTKEDIEKAISTTK
ncbi:MAG: AAA family ATPase [Salinivirgaceae bacterium]|nr:AAA family ATPase [Salinivirgaceae bacterium]